MSTIRFHQSEADFTQWFEMVYNANFENLYRYAFSITKNKELAEDVVSDVFAGIWQKRPDYNQIQEVKAYLHISVKHLAIRMVSRDPNHFSYSTYDETLQISDAVDPENLLVGKELDKIIEGIFENLSPHSRLVYEFSRNKGLTNQQIADELGISKRTVETHIHNVLKKFREQLAKYFKDANKDYSFFNRIGSLAVWILSIITLGS